MVSLNGRVRRLEGRGRQCPQCGWSPAAGEKVDIVVAWADLDSDEQDEQPEGKTEYCSLCGMPGEVVIQWLDLEDAEEGYQGGA